MGTVRGRWNMVSDPWVLQCIVRGHPLLGVPPEAPLKEGQEIAILAAQLHCQVLGSRVALLATGRCNDSRSERRVKEQFASGRCLQHASRRNTQDLHDAEELLLFILA